MTLITGFVPPSHSGTTGAIYSKFFAGSQLSFPANSPTFVQIGPGLRELEPKNASTTVRGQDDDADERGGVDAQIAAERPTDCSLVFAGWRQAPSAAERPQSGDDEERQPAHHERGSKSLQ